MKYIFYHYNSVGTLILDYSDEYTHKTQAYVFYSLQEALRKFRQDYNLRYRHVTVQKLY